MSSIFVASPVEVYHGADAEAKLSATNDLRFAENGRVLAVDAERWTAAQRYERDTWLVYNRETESDRNEEHRAGFDGYDALPDHLGNVIEVGCGPFTNLRYILTEPHTALSVTLADPLLSDYFHEHPNCTYRNNMLNGYPAKFIAVPIEEMPPFHYDTLIMINVLPHCYDARLVLDKVAGLLAPGGVLVFHEAPHDMTPEHYYDVGHPLNVSAETIDGFLTAFTPLYHVGNYFIGRKS